MDSFRLLELGPGLGSTSPERVSFEKAKILIDLVELGFLGNKSLNTT